MSLQTWQLVTAVLTEKNGRAMHIDQIMEEIQRRTNVSINDLAEVEQSLFKESPFPQSEVEMVAGKLGWFRAKAGDQSKSKRANETKRSKYPIKYKKMQQAVKDLLYVNYSYADELQRMKQQIQERRAEKQYLKMKLKGYKSGREAPLTYIAKSHSKRTSTTSRAAQVRLKKQKEKARAKASSAIAAAATATLEKLQKEQASVVKGMPTKRKRLKPGMIRKKLQPIPLDSQGHPVMPINLGGLTITSLGKIVSDRPGFHSERYIWPIGFESHRTFFSMHKPGTKCVYTCKLLDRGESPMFEIMASDDLDNPIQGSSATACHSTVLKRVNKTRSRDATNTGSGPEFFGFSHPVVMNILQNHPETHLLTKFQRVEFDDPLGVQNTVIKMPQQQSTERQRISLIARPEKPGQGDLALGGESEFAGRSDELNIGQSVDSSESGSSSDASGSSSESDKSSISGSEEWSESSESEVDTNGEGSGSTSSSDSNSVAAGIQTER